LIRHELTPGQVARRLKRESLQRLLLGWIPYRRSQYGISGHGGYAN
jgi:hypothetical protein